MVTVTLADLAYRYRQFLIAVVGAGVVMAMALLLAGLVGGLSEITQTVGGVGGDHWVLATASAGRIQSVGVFPQSRCRPRPNTGGDPSLSPRRPAQEVAHIDGKVQTVVVIGAAIGGFGDRRSPPAVRWPPRTDRRQLGKQARRWEADRRSGPPPSGWWARCRTAPCWAGPRSSTCPWSAPRRWDSAGAP